MPADKGVERNLTIPAPLLVHQARAQSMKDNSPKTYSISLRLRRTTIEYAYVSVLVTGDIMQADDEGNILQDANGHARIDPQKMVLRATELARRPTVTWYRESEQIEPHPIQKAPEADEMSEMDPRVQES